MFTKKIYALILFVSSIATCKTDYARNHGSSASSIEGQSGLIIHRINLGEKSPKQNLDELHKLAKDLSANGDGRHAIVFDLDEHEMSLSDQTYDSTYPNGDFYIFLGDIENLGEEKLWAVQQKVISDLIRLGFRVLTFPVARDHDVRLAIQDQKTVAIWWASHAAVNSGELFCTISIKKLPKDIFTNKPSPRLKLIYLNACNNNLAFQFYSLGTLKARGVSIIHWDGIVYSEHVVDDFKNNFLNVVKKVFKIL